MSLRDGLTSHPTVMQRYDHLVDSGDVRRDEEQVRLIKELDALAERIEKHRLSRKSSALGWLFARKREKETVTGLYIHGGVGRGKTMLMDVFYELLPVRKKRRAHFNDFMADVHDRIGRHRAALKNGETKESDPIPPVARELASEAWILCFDEFTVTDIADAMILSRLFSALFAEGVVLVATSNVAPANLYKDGLNRGLFLPFIDLLAEHVKVLEVRSETDYRLEKLNKLPVYLSPDDERAQATMDQAWETIAEGRVAAPAQIEVKGRKVEVPLSAGDAARFHFDDLCRRPLGARDYLAIANQYSTIFIDHVPVLGLAQRNEAKRFILLIDTLYDCHIRVFISAEAEPTALYTADRGTEQFEFERTASRLIEMQSRDWQQQHEQKLPVAAQ